MRRSDRTKHISVWSLVHPFLYIRSSVRFGLSQNLQLCFVRPEAGPKTEPDMNRPFQYSPRSAVWKKSLSVRSGLVITPHLRKIVFVNQRVDDENVDKVLLSLKEDSRVTVHDHDEHIIKSILFDGGSDYTRYQMYFTRIGSSVKTTSIRLYDMCDKLLDDEVFRGNCVAIALYIMWYETLPPIIGKKKINDGLSKEEDKDEEGEICSICYDENQADQMIGTLGCKHSYHEGCDLAVAQE
nr:hypothetical protein [Tanacetum cinerariifolium]